MKYRTNLEILTKSLQYYRQNRKKMLTSKIHTVGKMQRRVQGSFQQSRVGTMFHRQRYCTGSAEKIDSDAITVKTDKTQDKSMMRID
jgi:hypothetical protein